MRRIWPWAAGLAIVVVCAAFYWNRTPAPAPNTQPVVINEAVRTLLYLPVYMAIERGYFRDEGLDVTLITGGTAANSFAALLSGEAMFSVADPMYVPISMQHGARAVVLAQVVARIAVWGIAGSNEQGDWTAEAVRGKRVATQVRPMTAYVYAVESIRNLGLDPEKDVTLIESRPGTEIAPLALGQADFAFTLEPNASVAVSKGGRVVLSLPKQLGDRIFTGLLTTRKFVEEHPESARGALRAVQRAFDDLTRDPASAATVAAKYFDQVEPAVLRTAIDRLLAEGVFPRSVEIPEPSWNSAIAARVEAGDLKQVVSRDQACAVELMREVGGRE